MRVNCNSADQNDKNVVIRLFVWYIFIIVENRLKLFFLTSSMRASYKMQIGERMD